MAAVSTAPSLHGERHAARKWLIATAVMLGAVLELLDTSIVNVALPYMQGSFSASVDEITWVLTSYLVSNGIAIPMTGWISARFGRKRYYMTSISVFIMASALCGIAQSLTQIVVFRLIQGAAGAAMIPSSQAILMETFPPSEQALAMAVYGLGLISAPILGPTLGGWITYNWNWRWNFYINVPIGIIAMLMVLAFVYDPPYVGRKRPGRVDYGGILLLASSLGLLQIVLDRGQRSDWFSAPWVRYFTVGSALSFLLLVINELRFSDPIMDLRILKSHAFSRSVAIITVMVMTIYGINLLNPLFLQELMGYTAWKAGLAVAPRGIGAGAAMLSAGVLSRFGIDTRPLMGLGFGLAAYSIYQMSQWDLDVSMRSIFWPIMNFGVGATVGFPIITAEALYDIRPERMGFATSLYNMMRNTGAAIGISFVSNLLTEREQIHQAYLVQHFSVFDAWRMSAQAPQVPGALQFRFLPQLVTGQKQGLGLVYATIQAQAALLSYNDIYRLFALAMLCLVPWFVFFRKPPTGGSAPVH